MSSNRPIIVWFDRDLRLADHRPLSAAVRTGQPVLCVHVHDTETPGDARAGAASDWWLHHSLAALDADLRDAGAGLLLRRGRVFETLTELVESTDAAGLFWHRRHEPWAARVEQRLHEHFSTHRDEGFELKRFPGRLLHEPEDIRTGSGTPFRVFTPFWRRVLQAPEPRQPLPRPGRIRAPERTPEGESLDALALVPELDWAAGFETRWCPGEAGAQARFEAFLASGLPDYAARRDRPDNDGTSRLSPHLAFGEISPATIWHGCMSGAGDRSEPFRRELGWREFSWHLLAAQPALQRESLKPEFQRFPWNRDDELLGRWQRGRTGYPIVDAGMRQLWRTGWMHNRVRMVAGSLLVKQLLQPWQLGEAWFRDTLVDWDLASNAASWQWVAGTGTDAAPYFRVFNPVLQGRKFDPAGDYVRAWVPELATLPDKHLHSPWESPDAGSLDYPAPVVDPGTGRARALDAYAAMREANGTD